MSNLESNSPIWFESLLIKIYDICLKFFGSYGFGYGLRPKAEVFQGWTFGYGRRWKLGLQSNTAKRHHQIKIRRSTLWMFIRRKNYKMQLLSLKWIKSYNKRCKCWNCDLIFTANISLKDHISSLHQNKTLEMPALWCDICGKHFLEDHISSPHQNNKPCNCDARLA